MNINHAIFYEKIMINIAKLNYVINNPDQYDDIIKEHGLRAVSAQMMPVWPAKPNF